MAVNAKEANERKRKLALPFACDSMLNRHFGDSKGIRTPVIGVRGQRTNHYTIEPYFLYLLTTTPVIRGQAS